MLSDTAIEPAAEEAARRLIAVGRVEVPDEPGAESCVREAVTARGETAYTGDRGFVMVQATREPGAIRAAMLRGDFYASTGPLLRSLRRGPEALEIETTLPHTIELIGAGGAVLRAVHGTHARIALAEVEGSFVRGRVRDAQGRTAWTQPLWK